MNRGNTYYGDEWEESLLTEEFLRNARARFAIVGPPVAEAEVVAIFPNPFPGRDDLIQFFVCQNGGSRTELGGTVYCGSPEHRVSRDHLEKIRIEGFFCITSNPEERILGFRSMLACRATQLRTFNGVPEMKAFFERNMPIAYDHSGNYLLIDLQSGSIRFLGLEAYRDGPVEIAPSFREFVARFWINGQ